MNERGVAVAEVTSFDGRDADGDGPGRIFAEYARIFKHVESCMSDLALAIDTAQANCDRLRQSEPTPDVPAEFLKPLLLSLVSDIYNLQSAINGMKMHLASLAAGAEPR